MKSKLDQLRGGIAWGMTGYGPKPTLAPPDEIGNDGGADDAGGDDAGGSNDATGGTGKASDDAGGETRVAKAGGLFSKRSNGQQQAADDAGDDDDGGKEADGRPKGLADKFWNAKEGTINVDALIKAQRDGEKALGDLKRQKGPGGGEVPETADGYFSAGIPVPEEAANFKALHLDAPAPIG